MDDVKLVFNSIKEYPDMIKIVIYSEPIKISLVPKKIRVKREQKAREQRMERSIARTKATIRDLAICNQFEYFCTFTFDPKRYDSKRFSRCQSYMMNWFRNARDRHSRNLKYVCVAEKHKSGAFHFHVLLKNYNRPLRDSGHKKNGRTIYNVCNWMFGFSTAVRIDNQEAVAKYISKYVTKDLILDYSARSYFCSQGLVRPNRVHNVEKKTLRSLLHGKPEALDYADVDCEFYTLLKKDIDEKTLHMLNLA